MGLIHHVLRQANGNLDFPPGFLAQSRQPQMIAGNIAVQTVGSLFFFARAYSRVAIIKAWRLEDYILTLAWLCCTGYSICQYGQINNGAGRHIAAIVMEDPQAPVTSQKYAFVAQLLLFPALALSKLSICLTYLRIFYTDKWGRYMIQALMVLLVLLIVPFDFQTIFQCRPIHVYWTEGRPASKCLAGLSGFYANGSLNMFVDVALMAIVLPRILELQLHQRQRWALTTIVLLGSLAAAAGIVRMVRVSAAISMPDFEPSWDAYDISIWTCTELYVSLVCASAPGVKPFVVKILPKLLGSSMRSRSRTTGRASAGIELGLSSKWKRTTIGSARTNGRPSEAGLASAEGPYTQVGGGVDTRSVKGRIEEESETAGGQDQGGKRGHIYKTSEISVKNDPR